MMVQAPAFAALELLISLMISLTGFGIPLSVPPAAEDPFLARIAPEECLYYTRLAGVADPDAQSDNHIDKLLLEPQVRRFLTDMDKQIGQMIQFIEMQQGPDGNIAGATSKLIRMLATQPAAMFVSEFNVQPFQLNGGILLRLGDHQEEAQLALKQLALSPLSNLTSPVEIQGTEFLTAQPTPEFPQITWGIHDGYLMVGLGEHAIEGILQRARTPVPNWLEERLEQYALPRRATFTYADLEAIFNKTLEAVEEPDVSLIAQSIGLQHLKSYVSVAGLDETRWVSKTQIEFARPMSGLLNSFSAKPLQTRDLDSVPSDALVAMAARIDGRQLLTAANDFYEVQRVLGDIKQGIGVDVEQDFLEPLGDVLRIYASPREGGLISGWVASISLDDAKKLRETEQLLARRIGSEVTSSELGDNTYYSLTITPGYPLLPTWCLTDKELVIGLFPQAVRSHVEHEAQVKPLGESAEIKPLFAGNPGPVLLAHHDTAALLRTVYPFVQGMTQAYVSMLRQAGMQLDASILPSATAICRNLRPGVFSVTVNAEGLMLQTQQSLPGGSFGATAPIVAGALIPAANSARAAARRNAAFNNLRQIILATINHESTYGHYPAAYNTDENGEPLLSWRVHVLPFIDEVQLYEQFRLNEPWNSEHNRKLIPLMPQVYRAPDSHADPGKTVYVAVRDLKGVIVPPQENQNGKRNPVGTKVRRIKDGTSKTIVLVEASDELAVIWTKPDDFVPNDDDPIKGLVGLRNDGFIAAFGDGHVRVIGRTVPAETLHGLFTRDGGEIVQGY